MRSSAQRTDALSAKAGSYEEDASPAEAYRARAIARLALTPGQKVVDVGCGVGLSFRQLAEEVGPTGVVLGVDSSTAMLAQAGDRIRQAGLSNVLLLHARAETVQLGQDFDAAAFLLGHDIIRSTMALDNVLGQLCTSAKVLAGGAKWAPPWNLPLNVYVAWKSRGYVKSFEGFGNPWSHLEPRLEDVKVERAFHGAGYIMSGTTARGGP